MKSHFDISRISVPARIGIAAVFLASIALIAHARVFDLICDDALITVRFAQNLAMHGAPVYNLGERVEGYTSPLWMVLLALQMRVGIGAEHAVHLLGAASGVLLLASTWMLWRRIEPARTAPGIAVLAALAVSAPVAAWTMGGLETPLFAALVTLSIAIASKVIVDGGVESGAKVGVLLALTTLTRPEGAALTGIVVLAGLSLEGLRPGRFKTIVAIAVGYAAVIAPFEAWRWHYYGFPLPNTFYVKTSGGSALYAVGVRYLSFFAREMGETLIEIFVALLFIPVRGPSLDEPAELTRSRRAALWMARGFVVLLVPYVASVGGDFLDLYRFLVPAFPLVFVGAAHGACHLVALLPAGKPRIVAACAFGALLVPHVWHQIELGERARQISEPERAALSIEPLGWTRLFARRWSATGRWIAAHAHADAKEPDYMVTGAAGAMPFYSGIGNIDTLGLCDAWVSHHGRIIGTRPGHQREATEEYLLSRRPVFMMYRDHIEPTMRPPQRDAWWESKGYVWAVAKVGLKYGAGESFYHYFLLRADRAAELRGVEDIQTALDTR